MKVTRRRRPSARCQDRTLSGECTVAYPSVTYVQPQGGWCPIGSAVDRIAQARRHHLAALAYEAGARGLEWRLAGPGQAVLHVADRRTGRGVMVVAMPSSPFSWTFVWTGGGPADAADPVRAMDLIAHAIGR